eukprot:7989669-Alexandrium_andersonii.AAC.1
MVPAPKRLKGIEQATPRAQDNGSAIVLGSFERVASWWMFTHCRAPVTPRPFWGIRLSRHVAAGAAAPANPLFLG